VVEASSRCAELAGERRR